jgi:hypothetical protein
MPETKETKNVFEKEEKFLGQLFFDFEVNGVKTFMVLEKKGEWVIFDTGITGKAIIKLIFHLALSYPDFFSYALKRLHEAEETHEVPEGETVH